MNADVTKTIRAELARFHRRRNGKAVAIFCADLSAFLLLVAIAALSRSLIARVTAGCAAGFVTLRLASIAHDAGHLSYVSRRSWNKLIARLAFLPALQPFATWEVAHNVIHHSWTSIRGKDYVWIPFGKADFGGLSGFRKLLERACRSPLGHGLYYFVDLWLVRVVVPSLHWRQIPHRAQRIDILLIGSFAMVWLATTAALGYVFDTGAGSSVFFRGGPAIPYVVPALRLYPVPSAHVSRGEVFSRSRGMGILRLADGERDSRAVPLVFGWTLHGIFEHTVHHLDPLISYYELPAAQESLNRVLLEENVLCRWSLADFLHCCRV